MTDLDELGEAAWLPLALFAVFMTWRWRPALLAAGLAGRKRLQAWRNGDARAFRDWFSAGLLRWVPRIGWDSNLSSGNQSFDDHRNDALRKLEDEQREFQDFRKRQRQARDRSEFDAFMAGRAK